MNETRDRCPTDPAVSQEAWEIGTVTMLRAVGYVVGLPAFIVGTALFMLGFSLARGGILNAASILYAVACAAIAGRVAMRRFPPADGRAAAKLALAVLLAGLACYVVVHAASGWIAGLP